MEKRCINSFFRNKLFRFYSYYGSVIKSTGFRVRLGLKTRLSHLLML